MHPPAAPAIHPKSNTAAFPTETCRRELPVLASALPTASVPTQVHDYEGKETNVLVLNYTMACPLTCDFCCYGCHPGRAEKMPLDLALSLVAQAAEMKVFSSVGFTGGEPMLFFEELLTIGTTLLEFKLPFSIATAGHWATTPERSRRIVNELADRGLRSFHISHDPSHEKFVPSNYVVNAARAASERRIATCIVGTFYSSSESLAARLPELIDLPRVTLIDKFVAQVGRATKKEIPQHSHAVNSELNSFRCYRSTYHDITVFYDGMAYPCCSTFNRATPGIILGNAFKDSLRKLWERAEGSLMFRVMKGEGFPRMYEIIREFDPELYLQLPSADSVGPCHLCSSLFQKPETTERVSAVFSKYEQAKISNAVDMLVQTLGEDKVKAFIESTLTRGAAFNQTKEIQNV